VLVSRLPQESWIQTELRDSAPDDALVAPVRQERFGPWALANYQLADLRDAVRRLEYVSAVVGGVEPKPKPPEPTPRPGVAAAGSRRKQSAAGVAYLRRMRIAKGA